MLLLILACDGKSAGDPADTDLEVIPSSGDTGELGEEVPARVPDVIVDCAGGADFLTITEAIAASQSGTKIGLNPCTYHEDVNFVGKSLNIFGIEGSARTVIDGTGTGAVVKAQHGESLGTRLAGVTVTGGATNGYYGSGMNVDLAVMMLDDVVFTGNDVGYSVLYTTGAFLEFVDVSYTGNRVEPTGGILVMNNATLLAQRLQVDCTSTDFAIYQHNAMILLDSDIACGDEYGVYSAGNGVHVRRSRIESPGIALFGGDADDTRKERVWLYNSAFIGGDTAVSTLFMNVKGENNVFWGGSVGLDLQYGNIESTMLNSAAIGSTCAIRTDSSAIVDLGWNALEGPDCSVGGHDLVTNGMGFMDAPADFALEVGSALIDQGDPDADSEDVDGTRNDIGQYGGPEGEGQL